MAVWAEVRNESVTTWGCRAVSGHEHPPPRRYEKDPPGYGAVLTDVAGLIEDAWLGRQCSQCIDDRALLADWERIVEHDREEMAVIHIDS